MHSAAWPSCFTLASLFAFSLQRLFVWCLSNDLRKKKKWENGTDALCGVASTFYSEYFSPSLRVSAPDPGSSRDASLHRRLSMTDTKREDSQKDAENPRDPPPFPSSPSPEPNDIWHLFPLPHDGPKSFPRLSNSASSCLLMQRMNAALTSECMSALRCCCNACEPNMELVRAQLAPIASARASPV